MNNKDRFVNLAFASASAAFASLLTIVLTSEFGWAKFLAWVNFFVGIQSPFMVSSKYRHADWASWLGKKKV